MPPDPTRNSAPDAAASRFGESRFGPSRFGQGRGGAWVDEGAADTNGRSEGWYRPGSADGTVTGLTVVRPSDEASQSVQTSAAKSAITAPLHLPGGRHGVLLFHGLSSTPLELQFLARGLHRAGHTVRIAVIEGYSHGLGSSKPSDHRAWARAAVSEFDRMRQQCDTLAVGGLCIGALLSLHVAIERPTGVSHVLALSTTLHYDGWAAPRARWLLPLARMFPWALQIKVKEREPFGLKDERLRAWISAQMRESGRSDAGASVLRVGDLLEAQDLMGIVRRGLKKIIAPTLLIHATQDDCASPRSANEVASGVSSTLVQRVFLDDSYHMISIDREKARVLSEMKDFLGGQTVLGDGTVQAIGVAPAPTERKPEHVRA